MSMFLNYLNHLNMERCGFPHSICFRSWVLLEKANSFHYLDLRDSNMPRWWRRREVSLSSGVVYHCRAFRALRAGSTSTFYSSNPFENISRKSRVLVTEMSKQGFSTFLKIVHFFIWLALGFGFHEWSICQIGVGGGAWRERESTLGACSNVCIYISVYIRLWGTPPHLYSVF